MEWKCNRIFRTDTYTISEFLIDGVFICDMLEDAVRPLPETCPNTSKWKECECVEKIKHETAIPAGTYKVVLSYSNAFKKILPEIQNVPHFLGIRIHTGNSPKDTSGCLIPGTWDEKGAWVSSSTIAFNKIIEYAKKAEANNEQITLTIENM